MMIISKRKAKYHLLSFLKFDLKASITVFFVALPLCLGVALASNAPVYSGLISGVIGGLVVTFFSRSPLSVSGPAAGLTAICATAIASMGSLEHFFLSVAVAGLIQVGLGLFRLGGFTHFIPSAVIKGMLAAIGVILISKQFPLFLGYDKPDFWRNEFFNILTLSHGFQSLESLTNSVSAGVILIGLLSLLLISTWNKYVGPQLPFLPSSFVVVLFGALVALFFNRWVQRLSLSPEQYISIPADVFSQVRIPSMSLLFSNPGIWRNAIVIGLVASLETLLSIEAIDKLDPYNRITPQNRELVAQGVGNCISGMLGGLPITAVIVRSSANAEAGARTRASAMTHGIWLLLAIIVAIPLLNFIPYAVLAVILMRTGFNLVKPSMVKGVYRQGREQFLPFLVTVIAILFTDLLIGVLIGIGFAIYFIIKHTYRAGFTIKETMQEGRPHYEIVLALNVSFLNKKRIMEMLDRLPPHAVVEINGTKSVYIDHDILEVFQEFRSKAIAKNIELTLLDIPEVETIELH
ncbi:SulP family inorganic anion transporter [Flavihumibacter rivuli]|uniref:SulP family inorganic anion transporter n=1 Tax=Flavihumibacter rivuli TaxID=2838156 RepID=UPI001BDE428B|nr:SulP family inorganic anion transporter [Flavihumibacter rivuli]ULQ56707.1 SulP family inorganic anion transporter [Flavihumibacter rivuli]